MNICKVYCMFLKKQKRLLQYCTICFNICIEYCEVVWKWKWFLNLFLIVLYYMLSYLQRLILTFEKVKVLAKPFSDSLALYTFSSGTNTAQLWKKMKMVSYLERILLAIEKVKVVAVARCFLVWLIHVKVQAQSKIKRNGMRSDQIDSSSNSFYFCIPEYQQLNWVVYSTNTLVTSYVIWTENVGCCWMKFWFPELYKTPVFLCGVLR